jgi:hypothetical protein
MELRQRLDHHLRLLRRAVPVLHPYNKSEDISSVQHFVMNIFEHAFHHQPNSITVQAVVEVLSYSV